MSQAPTLDRETVVAAAGDLLDANGVDSLSLTRVAEALGVTQPALYRHINGLNDLWRLLGLASREELAAHLASATVGRSGRDAVHAVAGAWRRYGQQHPGRYRSTERFSVSGDAELEAAVDRVIAVLGMSLRAFDLPDDQLVHGARTLRSALHGFVSFELGDGHPTPPDPDSSFNHLIDLLCIGFEAHASNAD